MSSRSVVSFFHAYIAGDSPPPRFVVVFVRLGMRTRSAPSLERTVSCSNNADAIFGDKVVKRTLQGTYAPVPAEHFAGLSVALYFAKLRHPKCARIFPSLKQVCLFSILQ